MVLILAVIGACAVGGAAVHAYHVWIKKNDTDKPAS